MLIVRKNQFGRRPWPVRLLVAGDLLVTPGAIMAALALPWIAHDISGKAWLGAVVLGAEAAPPLLGRRTSALVSRWLSARRIVIAADAARALLVALVVLAYLSGALSPVLLVTVALVMGVAIVPQYAAQRALATAHCADEADVGWMAGWFTATWHIGLLAGPPLAAAAIGLAGAEFALALYALMFAVSALLATFVPDPPAREIAGDEVDVHDPVPATHAPSGQWRIVLRSTVMVDACNGALMVAWLPAVLLLSDAGPGLAASALTTLGATGLLVSWVVMRRAFDPETLRSIAVVCTLVAAMLLVPPLAPWTVLPAGALFGIAATTVITSAHVVIGRMPEASQLEAHATLAQWCQATMPLGYLAAAGAVWLAQPWLLPAAVGLIAVAMFRRGSAPVRGNGYVPITPSLNSQDPAA